MIKKEICNFVIFLLVQICLSIYLSIHLSIYVFICLYIYLGPWARWDQRPYASRDQQRDHGRVGGRGEGTTGVYSLFHPLFFFPFFPPVFSFFYYYLTCLYPCVVILRIPVGLYSWCGLWLLSFFQIINFLCLPYFFFYFLFSPFSLSKNIPPETRRRAGWRRMTGRWRMMMMTMMRRKERMMRLRSTSKWNQVGILGWMLWTVPMGRYTGLNVVYSTYGLVYWAVCCVQYLCTMCTVCTVCTFVLCVPWAHLAFYTLGIKRKKVLIKTFFITYLLKISPLSVCRWVPYVWVLLQPVPADRSDPQWPVLP